MSVLPELRLFIKALISLKERARRKVILKSVLLELYVNGNLMKHFKSLNKKVKNLVTKLERCLETLTYCFRTKYLRN